MTTFTHDDFISPFTWRYGSQEMRRIFSERHKRLLLRRIWIALAKAEGFMEALSAYIRWHREGRLKAFDEEDGVESYGKAADLLIAWYLQETA